jgi:alpha-amylase
MQLLTAACVLAIGFGTGLAGDFDDPHMPYGRGTIVHLFEWTWDAIARECEEFLAPYAYGGVQISPPMEHVYTEVYGKVPWWVRYQPVSYHFKSRSGDDGQFRSMINRCNKVGVRIYADVIINHMAGVSMSGTGVDGSGYNAHERSFPAVPYGRGDFHKYCEINYGDAQSIHDCYVLGLTDLNTEKGYVQGKLKEYLNRLLDAGVAGFRVDTAKHIPADSLKAIYYGLRNVRGDVGYGRPFIYNEVIDYNDQVPGARMGDYFGAGRVTNFMYGRFVSDCVRRSNNFKYTKNFGEGWGMPSRHEEVHFIDNHDSQRSGCGGGGCGDTFVLTHKNSYQYTMAVTFMLAHDYGIPRVMSSFFFNSNDQGPPSNGAYYTRNPEFESRDGICRYSSGWQCEHRWPEIKNMARFRAATYGEGTQVVATDDHRIAFRRGHKGFFMVNNNGGQRWSGRFYTGLPAGRYCDVIEGDISHDKSTCTDYNHRPNGNSINVDGSGHAQVSVQQGKTFAISLASKIN